MFDEVEKWSQSIKTLYESVEILLLDFKKVLEK
jgi:hypothetical protein